MKKVFYTLCLIMLAGVTNKIFSQFPASNTNCSGAIAVTLGSTVIGGGDNYGAPVAGPAVSCVGFPDDDVWYKFDAPQTGRVTIEVNSLGIINPALQVFSGTCGAFVELGCEVFTNNRPNYMYVSNLGPFQTYYVRIFTQAMHGDNGNFELKINSAGQPPANDDCAGAVNIPLRKLVDGTTIDATGPRYNLGTSECTGGFDDDEVWYKFTATQNGEVNVSAYSPVTGYSFSIKLYSGTCGNLNELNVSCSYSSSSYCCAVAGQTYYAKVYNSGGNLADHVDFQISVSGPGVEPVANDDCRGAYPLNSANNYMLAGQSTAQATPSYLSSCEFTDVWYEYYANTTNGDVSIILDQTSSNWSIFVYKGGSQGFVCDYYNPTYTVPQDVNQTTNANQIIGLDVVAGSYYYIRVQHRGCNDAAGTFRITLNDPTIRPVNDNCDGAKTVAYNTTLTDQNNSFATHSNQPLNPSCNGIVAGTADDDLWYKFTTPAGANGTLIRVTSTNNDMVLFLSQACGVNPIYCSNTAGTSETLWLPGSALPGGVTYWLRIYTWAPDGGLMNFEITVKDSAFAANDEPCGAVQLTYNAAAINGSAISSTKTVTPARPTNCSTDINNVPLASGSTGQENDVWFKFTYSPAPGTNGMVITAKTTNATDPVFYLYTGTNCSNLTSATCSNTAGNERLRLRDLTPYTTYFIRVHEFFNRPMNFTIQAKDTIFALNDVCTGAVNIPFNTSLANQNNTNMSGPIFYQNTCSGPPTLAEDDSWFKFTPTGTIASVNIQTTNNTNPVLYVYSVDPSLNCRAGGATILTCSNTGGQTFETLSLTGLTPNKEYFLRVYDQQTNPMFFTIYAGEQPVSANTFTFMGSGNWNVAANWLNNSMPPSVLPAGKEIILGGTGECILNVPQTLSPGSKLTIMPGRTLKVIGDITSQ